MRNCEEDHIQMGLHHWHEGEVKHVAFKEEQECRIIKICRIDEVEGVLQGNKRIYCEYNPDVSRYVKKIYFGPKATEIDLFQGMLKLNKKKIECEKSNKPLA